MPSPGHYLDLAARAALRAAGDVQPNPMVGAVIVKNDQIIGMGHHKKFGGLHAEREALADCRARGHNPSGSTIYVTLEPCCHHGKQPPCTDALIEAGIARVVAARPDPNPVSCGGARILVHAGIPVEFCPDSQLAVDLSAPFIKRTGTGLPWVIAKWAQTLDGRIATASGESKWISGELSRRRVHRLRAHVDAIICGIGTALADDPLLTARGPSRIRRIARRVVLDSSLQLPARSALIRTARQTPLLVICDHNRLTGEGPLLDRRKALEAAGAQVVGVAARDGRLDLEVVLRLLSKQHNASNVLFEAGPQVLGSLLQQGLADELIVYIAPVVLGEEYAKSAVTGMTTPSLVDARRFELRRMRRYGPDIELTYRAPATPTAQPTTPSS
jgi:diaminohydroxyphosphoribosylaminopyrimidine deaminase / 5-amino-6-(5-phosphoribosylamino)uracil reductase